METPEFEDEFIDHEEQRTLAARTCFDRMKDALHGVQDIYKYLCRHENADIRTLKVADLSYPGTRGLYNHVAHIRLAGRWVERAGFERGDHVQVITVKGMVLVVPVQPPPDPEEWE